MESQDVPESEPAMQQESEPAMQQESEPAMQQESEPAMQQESEAGDAAGVQAGYAAGVGGLGAPADQVIDGPAAGWSLALFPPVVPPGSSRALAGQGPPVVS